MSIHGHVTILLQNIPELLDPESQVPGIAGSKWEFLHLFHLGMGRQVRCLNITSILLKYCDEILQRPLHLPTHVMEGIVKILETYPKSEEAISIYHKFSCICRLYTVLVIM